MVSVGDARRIVPEPPFNGVSLDDVEAEEAETKPSNSTADFAFVGQHPASDEVNLSAILETQRGRFFIVHEHEALGGGTDQSCAGGTTG